MTPEGTAENDDDDGATKAAETSETINATADDEKSWESVAHHAAGCIVKLYAPITLCAALVLVGTHFTLGGRLANGYGRSLEHPTGISKAAGKDLDVLEVVAVVGAFVALVVFTTWVLIAAYYCRCYAFIRVWLMLVTFFILFVSALNNVLFKALQRLRLPVDWITVVVLVWNFAVAGVATVHCAGPKLLKQLYLVVTAALVAITAVQTFDEVTTWAVLGALAAWDLCAVLSPCGPLRIMVQIAQRRGEPLFPSLVYAASTTMAFVCCAGEGEEEEDDDKSIKLGLGDFIFYSLLLARSYLSAGLLSLLSAYVAVLLGLTVTLLMCLAGRQALPALPISIVLGMATHFCVAYFVSPFWSVLQNRQLFA